LSPVFEVDLVGFVDEQNVSLASSDFLRLVDADELNHVAPELVSCIALIVEVGVVYFFLVEYLEEVPHGGGTKCGECLSAYGNNESRVLVAKLYESREDTESLSATTSALMNLNLCL